MVALVLVVLEMGPSPLHIPARYSTAQPPSQIAVALNENHIKQTTCAQRKVHLKAKGFRFVLHRHSMWGKKRWTSFLPCSSLSCSKYAQVSKVRRASQESLHPHPAPQHTVSGSLSLFRRSTPRILLKIYYCASEVNSDC